MEKLTKEQLTLLRSPLPAEAISQHPTKPYLSSIKAIYVVERINQVFGIGNWRLISTVVKDDTAMIVVKAVLTIPEYGIELESYGGNDNGGENNKNFDLGDAYKGATTDALTKIGSYLEIGMDVFKGLSNKKGLDSTPAKKEFVAPKVDTRKAEIAKLLSLNFPSPIKSPGEYKEICMTLTGLELLPENYEAIINQLKQ